MTRTGVILSQQIDVIFLGRVDLQSRLIPQDFPLVYARRIRAMPACVDEHCMIPPWPSSLDLFA